MKPLFTLHAGEYLVGSYIEQHFKRVNVWVPSKDTGVDLLVTNRKNHQSVSLQVKFSKDYSRTKFEPDLREKLRASGWWTIDHDKLRTSPAEYWVFVLASYEKRAPDFVIVPRKKLFRRLRGIHGLRDKKINSYLCVTKNNKCWEARDLRSEGWSRIADGKFRDGPRNFTEWLNKWDPIENLNK